MQTPASWHLWLLRGLMLQTTKSWNLRAISSTGQFRCARDATLIVNGTWSVLISFDGPCEIVTDNYYYQYAIGNRADAIAMAKRCGKKTNLKNLKEYILPTKGADFILHAKTVGTSHRLRANCITGTIDYSNLVIFYNSDLLVNWLLPCPGPLLKRKILILMGFTLGVSNSH